MIEAGDIIVWIAAAMMSFFAVFFANSGEVRWYEIAALLTGFVLYTVSVSKYFIAFVKFSAKFFAKTLKIMLMPVVQLLKSRKKSIGFSYFHMSKSRLYLSEFV
ncbi:MAG: spore cortex biosynthesis protein YabQ [Clostridiales bacterium]|nr:MAG: spore cortex biosynthesis protein YabQ [Clostridiales bacterium]